jgi:hypothetical protein
LRIDAAGTRTVGRQLFRSARSRSDQVILGGCITALEWR